MFVEPSDLIITRDATSLTWFRFMSGTIPVICIVRWRYEPVGIVECVEKLGTGEH